MADGIQFRYNASGVTMLNNLGASGTVNGAWFDINKLDYISVGASVPSGTLKLQWRDSNDELMTEKTLEQWTTHAFPNIQRRGQIRFRVESGQVKVVGVGVSGIT